MPPRKIAHRGVQTSKRPPQTIFYASPGHRLNDQPPVWPQPAECCLALPGHCIRADRQRHMQLIANPVAVNAIVRITAQINQLQRLRRLEPAAMIAGHSADLYQGLDPTQS